jgi:hypothetical protein
MELSQYGKALLKSLGGDPRLAKATPSAIKRFSIDKPESLFYILPNDLAERLVSLPDGLLNLPETDLEVQAGPSRQDRRVKQQFWEEYELAGAEKRGMNMEAAVTGAGVGSWAHYELMIAESAAKLVWLMTPPIQYKIQLRAALDRGLTRLHDILDLPLMQGNKPDIGVGLLILQAVRYLDARIHGAITQKMFSVTVDGTAQAQQRLASGNISTGSVDERIAELERLLLGQEAAEQRVDKGLAGPLPQGTLEAEYTEV